LGETGNRLRELEWCGEFRQTGMIAAVELVRDKKSREPFPPELRVGYRIYREGLKRGVFMRPLGDVIYFIPPLIIMEKEMETMVDMASESIRAVLEK
jgi:adenosylmethionine-8-amino-7-oxononanoate aminotransferase